MLSPSYSDAIKTKNTDYLLAYNVDVMAIDIGLRVTPYSPRILAQQSGRYPKRMVIVWIKNGNPNQQ